MKICDFKSHFTFPINLNTKKAIFPQKSAEKNRMIRKNKMISKRQKFC